MTTGTLYHYTCGHAAAQIDKAGEVRPMARWGDWREYDDAIHARFGYRTGLRDAPAVSWWTDLADPDPDGLGLTRSVLSCDRTEARFSAAHDDRFQPWRDYAAEWGADLMWRMQLEIGRSPDRWWVTTQPVEVER